MKGKTKNIIKALAKNDGLVIVEAAIVFPVMFFVLLFIIYIGNMYFEQARVDSIVMSAAVRGASYVSDPNLYSMDNGGTVPYETSSEKLKIEPYRYIIGSISNGSIKEIENKLSNEVKNDIQNGSLIFFSSMKSKVTGSDGGKTAKFNNYVVYSTFIVQVNYEIKFPIRFLGSEEPTIAKLTSRAEVAVNDSPEMIRNIDMVVDLLEGNETAENIKGFFDKINDFISKFAAK